MLQKDLIVVYSNYVNKLLTNFAQDLLWKLHNKRKSNYVEKVLYNSRENYRESCLRLSKIKQKQRKCYNKKKKINNNKKKKMMMII